MPESSHDLVPPRPPASSGKEYRDRLHRALVDHPALSPEAMLDHLAGQVEADPIGVLRAISATLPKEAEAATAPQQTHLHLVKLVGAARERGLDLTRLLEPATIAPADEFPSAPAMRRAADEDDWLR